MSRPTPLADYGVVALVGGGAALVLTGMLTLGLSAFLGRLPVFLVVLLVALLVVTLVGLAITLTVGRSDSAE